MLMPQVKDLLCQSSHDATTLGDALEGLNAIFGTLGDGEAAGGQPSNGMAA
jgi:hypothetical protein